MTISDKFSVCAAKGQNKSLPCPKDLQIIYKLTRTITDN